MRNGYENTTLALILKELSIPKGVFYHYFASKEECADLCIEMRVNLCIGKMLDNDSLELSADQRLIRMMLFCVRFFHDDEQEDARMNAPDNAVFHQKLMIALTRQLAPVYSKMIAKGVEEQVFGTEFPLEAAEMIISLANFYLDADLFRWEQEMMDKKILAFSDAMEKILGARKGTFHFIGSMR
ncbi:TetR/AcrR family transcriptional regulator [Paenibacillus timonensis]|uniref:TetR/AcrR family transcriptional regulator n=1 Tax=Paenibacillus timonensis TaxID=225915 RepID=A0ABW3SB56_9BACL|nr:TetR/AcrR family transcriptional regulator [Paenibacillus timonensis]